MVQVMNVLDQLEDDIEGLKQVPLTGGKVLIEQEVIVEYINEIRAALPEDIVKAHWVQQERTKILEDTKAECEKQKADTKDSCDKAIQDAKEKYDQIIQEATAKAEELVSEHIIVTQAQDKAERIVEEANLKAKKLKEGSKEYVSSVFDELLGRMEELSEIIKKDKNDINNL